MTATTATLRDIYSRKGDDHYGENVSQLSHAMHCAELAKADMQPDELVIACFLHDIGHMVEPEKGFDVEAHDRIGADYLSRMGFQSDVVEPVRQHAEAKRYLCLADQEYYSNLSEASQRSLVFQGDTMTKEEARAFELLPQFEACIALRQYDDLGKSKNYQMSDADWIFALIEGYFKP